MCVAELQRIQNVRGRGGFSTFHYSFIFEFPNHFGRFKCTQAVCKIVYLPLKGRKGLSACTLENPYCHQMMTQTNPNANRRRKGKKTTLENFQGPLGTWLIFVNCPFELDATFVPPCPLK